MFSEVITSFEIVQRTSCWFKCLALRRAPAATGVCFHVHIRRIGPSN